MNINLLWNTDNCIEGWLNISQFPSVTQNKEMGSIVILDRYVDFGEADEIVALDVINYLDNHSLNSALDNWSKKLRIGGQLTVSATDLFEVAKSMSSFRADEPTINSLLFGDSTVPTKTKKSCYSCMEVVKMLEARGLKIMLKRVNNMQFVIKAVRIN